MAGYGELLKNTTAGRNRGHVKIVATVANWRLSGVLRSRRHVVDGGAAQNVAGQAELRLG